MPPPWDADGAGLPDFPFGQVDRDFEPALVRLMDPAALSAAASAAAAAAAGDASAVGVWGEALVAAWLGRLLDSPAQSRPLLPCGGALLAFQWVNAGGETGAAFDIRLRVARPSLEERDEFIEARALLRMRALPRVQAGGNDSDVCPQVKSSSRTDKHFFEISERELSFAAERGGAYHIYRVSGAAAGAESSADSADGLQVACITDPLLLWREHKITVCVLV